MRAVLGAQHLKLKGAKGPVSYTRLRLATAVYDEYHRTYFPRPTSPKGRAWKVLVLLGEHSSPKPPRATQTVWGQAGPKPGTLPL